MKKIFPLFAVIIVLVLAVCSFHIIPTGYTGVKTSFGQILLLLLKFFSYL